MQEASLDQLFQTLRGFQESRALLSAVELNVFGLLGDGGTAAEMAARIDADARATEMLLNALVAIGALQKEDSRFLPTGASRELGRQTSGLMHIVRMWNSWGTLTECVRRGTTVGTPGVEAKDPAWTRDFIAAMHRNAEVHAPPVVDVVRPLQPRRMLDIGGGSGAYSIACVKAVPGLTAVVFDLAAVLPIAKEHIRQAEAEDRVQTQAGDLRRDEFGEVAFDLILLSAICHMLSPEENLDLLARCARALQPGGWLLIRDFLLDTDKTSPKPAALFSLNMLVATQAGASYSEAEYTNWLKASGFGSVERPVPGGDFLLACRN